jgi:predicted transcriptional regulator
MDDEVNTKGRLLDIRSRQTFWGDGPPTQHLGVLCHRRGLEVSLDTCARCDHSAGLRLDATLADAYVVCDAPVDADETDGGKDFAGDARADRTPIAAIMTTRVVCVGPRLPVVALEALFLERGISGAPVVDELGRPIGIVSKTDLVRHHHETRAAGPTEREPVVEDIMVPMAFCLPANESVARSAALMAFEGMHRVPVVNAHGRIVGLVSPLDVMRWIARTHGYVLGLGPR